MKVQERVSNYVQNNGIKQSHIVSRTGLSKDVVSAILNLRRRMTADEYELFCIALNVEPNSFMNLNEEKISEDL